MALVAPLSSSCGYYSLSISNLAGDLSIFQGFFKTSDNHLLDAIYNKADLAENQNLLYGTNFPNEIIYAYYETDTSANAAISTDSNAPNNFSFDNTLVASGDFPYLNSRGFLFRDTNTLYDRHLYYSDEQYYISTGGKTPDTDIAVTVEIKPAVCPSESAKYYLVITDQNSNMEYFNGYFAAASPTFQINSIYDGNTGSSILINDPPTSYFYYSSPYHFDEIGISYTDPSSGYLHHLKYDSTVLDYVLDITLPSSEIISTRVNIEIGGSRSSTSCQTQNYYMVIRNPDTNAAVLNSYFTVDYETTMITELYMDTQLSSSILHMTESTVTYNHYGLYNRDYLNSVGIQIAIPQEGESTIIYTITYDATVSKYYYTPAEGTPQEVTIEFGSSDCAEVNTPFTITARRVDTEQLLMSGHFHIDPSTSVVTTLSDQLKYTENLITYLNKDGKSVIYAVVDDVGRVKYRDTRPNTNKPVGTFNQLYSPYLRYNFREYGLMFSRFAGFNNNNPGLYNIYYSFENDAYYLNNLRQPNNDDLEIEVTIDTSSPASTCIQKNYYFSTTIAEMELIFDGFITVDENSLITGIYDANSHNLLAYTNTDPTKTLYATVNTQGNLNILNLPPTSGYFAPFNNMYLQANDFRLNEDGVLLNTIPGSSDYNSGYYVLYYDYSLEEYCIGDLKKPTDPPIIINIFTGASRCLSICDPNQYSLSLIDIDTGSNIFNGYVTVDPGTNLIQSVYEQSDIEHDVLAYVNDDATQIQALIVETDGNGGGIVYTTPYDSETMTAETITYNNVYYPHTYPAVDEYGVIISSIRGEAGVSNLFYNPSTRSYNLVNSLSTKTNAPLVDVIFDSKFCPSDTTYHLSVISSRTSGFIFSGFITVNADGTITQMTAQYDSENNVLNTDNTYKLYPYLQYIFDGVGVKFNNLVFETSYHLYYDRHQALYFLDDGTTIEPVAVILQVAKTPVSQVEGQLYQVTIDKLHHIDESTFSIQYLFMAPPINEDTLYQNILSSPVEGTSHRVEQPDQIFYTNSPFYVNLNGITLSDGEFQYILYYDVNFNIYYLENLNNPSLPNQFEVTVTSDATTATRAPVGNNVEPFTPTFEPTLDVSLEPSMMTSIEPTFEPTSAQTCSNKLVNFISTTSRNIPRCHFYPIPDSSQLIEICGYDISGDQVVSVRTKIYPTNDNNWGLGLPTISLTGFLQLSTTGLAFDGEASLRMSQVLQGNVFSIYGSNTKGVLGRDVLFRGEISGEFFRLPDVSRFAYISITGNTLIKGIQFPCPGENLAPIVQPVFPPSYYVTPTKPNGTPAVYPTLSPVSTPTGGNTQGTPTPTRTSALTTPQPTPSNFVTPTQEPQIDGETASPSMEPTDATVPEPTETTSETPTMEPTLVTETCEQSQTTFTGSWNMANYGTQKKFSLLPGKYSLPILAYSSPTNYVQPSTLLANGYGISLTSNDGYFIQINLQYIPKSCPIHIAVVSPTSGTAFSVYSSDTAGVRGTTVIATGSGSVSIVNFDPAPTSKFISFQVNPVTRRQLIDSGMITDNTSEYNIRRILQTANDQQIYVQKMTTGPNPPTDVFSGSPPTSQPQDFNAQASKITQGTTPGMLGIILAIIFIVLAVCLVIMYYTLVVRKQPKKDNLTKLEEWITSSEAVHEDDMLMKDKSDHNITVVEAEHHHPTSKYNSGNTASSKDPRVSYSTAYESTSPRFSRMSSPSKMKRIVGNLRGQIDNIKRKYALGTETDEPTATDAVINDNQRLGQMATAERYYDDEDDDGYGDDNDDGRRQQQQQGGATTSEYSRFQDYDEEDDQYNDRNYRR